MSQSGGKQSGGTPPRRREAVFHVARLKNLLHFIRLDDDDAALLRELREPVEAAADRMVQTFYEHLNRFAVLKMLLDAPGRMEHLKMVQRDYLLSLTEGRFDQAYLDDRLRIGRAHERIGLDPQWYLGANSIHLEHLIPIVLKFYKDEPKKAARACLTLTKLMNLDAQIVLDAYFQERQQKAVEQSQTLAAVGELAASIAHEVRNPLAGMKGALEVLRKDLAVAPAKTEIVDELLAQNNRLEGLVRDLLAYARPRPLDRQPMDLHGLLDRVFHLAREGQGNDTVEIRTHYKAGPEPILADDHQLEQVFLNLIQNAFQAMPEGGRLTISTDQNEKTVSVSLKDTGKGISPVDMPRIFQPFFTTKHRGSGLGLAIVQKITRAHGGEIEISSRKGEGTRARVTLPRGEPA